MVAPSSSPPRSTPTPTASSTTTPTTTTRSRCRSSPISPRRRCGGYGIRGRSHCPALSEAVVFDAVLEELLRSRFARRRLASLLDAVLVERARSMLAAIGAEVARGVALLEAAREQLSRLLSALLLGAAGGRAVREEAARARRLRRRCAGRSIPSRSGAGSATRAAFLLRPSAGDALVERGACAPDAAEQRGNRLLI